jgi:hypothetical protein
MGRYRYANTREIPEGFCRRRRYKSSARADARPCATAGTVAAFRFRVFDQVIREKG